MRRQLWTLSKTSVFPFHAGNPEVCEDILPGREHLLLFCMQDNRARWFSGVFLILSGLGSLVASFA